MPNWSKFVEMVTASQRFVLTSHVRPDCDALGSELALAAVLESLGKDVVVCNAFAVPPNYRFLDPGGKLLQLGVDLTAAELESYDVLIILDTSAWAQLGAMGEVIRATNLQKVVIDHHVGGDELGADLLKDTHAEATGRLVVDAADALGVRLTPESAQCALAALATDTGWFRFSSTSAETLHLAARLMGAGADPARLYKDLYEEETLARLKLAGRTMAKATVELDGRLIYTWIEQSDFAAVGALPSDSEDMINTLLSVSGTEAALIFVEQASGGFKISFRSRCDLDCSELASRCGGGGHRKAAGAFAEGPLESVRSRGLDAVRGAMQ
jgi:phosphoesterase RecJ-like protein